MPNGYNGKILRVDLSAGVITVEEPKEEFYRTYLGGRGIIAYYLLKEVKPGTDPLGPDNRLVFAGGPLTGVPLAGTGRNSVGAKSPLTGVYGDAEVGGYWGAELRHAGYDAIVVTGKSAKPVYISIIDGKAEIRDGSHIWGKTTLECEKIIKQELGDNNVRIAQTGVAGENLVRFACVVNDLSHVAGRCGIGAVMGAKKLRAVAVRGHGKVPVANEEAVGNIAKRLTDFIKSDRFSASMSDLGTAGQLMALNTTGGLPTRNFKQDFFEGAEKISGETMKGNVMVGRRGCFACAIRCKPEVKINDKYIVDPDYGGPEYETLAALGSNCGVDDLKAVAKANELCNAYGLDTISTGVAISFAMECFENGILTERDTGGMKLGFGNAEAMVRLVEMIARREGIGATLAEGVARAAKVFGKGAEEYAMHVKQQEIPMHEPRLKQGLGVGYAVSPTGADHCHNVHDTLNSRRVASDLRAMGVLEPLPNADLSAGKMRMLAYGTMWENLLNTLVYCRFVHLRPEEITETVRAVTGWNTTDFELLKAGERCITMGRLFDVREGTTPADDRLPGRFFTPFDSGPLKGVSVKEDDFRKAVETYYAMLGWDSRGVPTAVKLAELGISWAAGT